MPVIKYLVDGIVCTGCALDMENIMLDMEGVVRATVSFGDGVFSITYDPVEIDAKTITKKVKSLGFKTKILTE